MKSFIALLLLISLLILSCIKDLSSPLDNLSEEEQTWLVDYDNAVKVLNGNFKEGKITKFDPNRFMPSIELSHGDI